MNVLNLKEQGVKEEEIPQNLSPFFQEKEIISLIDEFKKLPTLDGNQELKSSLKISLWVLSFFKIFILTTLLMTTNISLLWKLAIFFLSFIIIGFVLYFTYKGYYENVFLILLLFLGLSSDSFVDNIWNLFVISTLSIYWWLSLLVIVASIVSLFTSWKLRKIYSNELLKLKELLIKEKLNFI